MIKIIKISNLHIFDNKYMSEKDFYDLLYILERNSKYKHSYEIIRNDKKEFGSVWKLYYRSRKRA